MQFEKAELEKKSREEIASLEDVDYVMFKQGFNKAVAQVKHFNTSLSIDFFRVDREKTLKDIIEQQSLVE